MKYNRAAQRIHGILIYARFSTENQSDKSIEEQIADCKAWCEAQGLPVLGVYADYAVSGMKASRPQFDAMLDALRAGEGDTLVCYDQSRLARDFLNWFALRQELQQMGVRIVSVTQDYVGGDIQDSSVLIQETIIALHNQMHVADTRRKTKAALRYRFQQGLHTGGKPPLGYDVKDKRLVVNEAEAAIVRRIFTEYSQGKTYHDIIAGLNADGLKTKGGKPFGSNSLHDLMKNRRYIGEFVYGGKAYANDGTRLRSAVPEDTLTIEHPELAIVSRELFDSVQVRMALNKRTQAGRPASARDYPLRGKVFCGECGSAMQIQAATAKGTKYYYYTCGNKKSNRGCSCRKIRADALEDKAASYVRAILGNADVVGAVRAAIRQEVNGMLSGGIAKAEAAAKELAAVELKLEHLVDSLAELGKSDTLVARIKALEGERAQLRAKLANLRNAAEISAAPETLLDEMLYTITANYSDAAVLSVITRIEVYEDTIRIFTSFDPKPDPDKSREPIDTEEFIKIDGTSARVPKSRGYAAHTPCFLSKGTRTDLNADTQWVSARRRLDGADTTIKSSLFSNQEPTRRAPICSVPPNGASIQRD